MNERKIALLFPGQGGQYPCMGKELYENFDVAKDVFNRAKNAANIAIDEVCFSGTQELLKDTLNSQLGVLTVSIAAFEVLRKSISDFSFVFTSGLSLGEYSALYAAGVIGFEETFLLVKKRALLMQKACKEKSGTMVSILGLNEDSVNEICRNVSSFCAIANLNCPGQIVVSCDKSVANEVMQKAKEKGARKSIELQVAGAFHSEYMASASESFEEELRNIKFNLDNADKVIFNLKGMPYDKSTDDIKNILKDHITHPVLWEKSIRYMMGKGINCFIELGPGRILGGLLKRIDKNVVYSNIEDRKSFDRTINLLNISI